MARPLESAWVHRLWLWLAIALAAFAIASCGTGPSGGPQRRPTPPLPKVAAPPPEIANPPQMAGRQPVRVALLLPFSSSDREVQQVAQALLNSGELALFEVNNPDVLLLPKDTHATADGAAAAAREAIGQGAELILGPLLRDEVAAVAPIAHQYHVPVIAFSTDRSVAGNGVYLLSFQPEQEVARVTQYAATHGHRVFAAMIPNSDYGARVRDAFVNAARSSGGNVIALQNYDRNAAAMADPVKSLASYEKRFAKYGYNNSSLSMPDPANGGDLTRLMQYQSYGSEPFDAVLLPEGGALLHTLAPLLPYYDVDPHKVQFLGTGLWDDPSLGREPALDGGWFAAPSPDAQQAFLTRYKDAYAKSPPRIASLSFDAVALAGSMARAPKGHRFTDQALTNPNGFTGIDGIFRFTPNGDTQRGLAVLEITDQGFKVIDPAPTTFETRADELVADDLRDQPIEHRAASCAGDQTIAFAHEKALRGQLINARVIEKRGIKALNATEARAFGKPETHQQNLFGLFRWRDGRLACDASSTRVCAREPFLRQLLGFRCHARAVLRWQPPVRPGTDADPCAAAPIDEIVPRFSAGARVV